MAKNKISSKEKKCKDFIDLAFSVHKNGTFISTADRLLRSFRGGYNSITLSQNQFNHNTIFGLVVLMIPNFIIHNPRFRLKAKSPRFLRETAEGIESIDNIKQARLIETVVNNEYKQINAIEEDRKALFDALFYGFGLTKTGYSYETTSRGNKSYITKDSAFHNRVNPHDFGWHPLATCPDDSTKLVHRLYMPRSRAESFEIFDKKKLDTIQDSLPKHVKERSNKIYKKEIEDYVTIYEVHDQERDMIYYYGGEERTLLGKKGREYNFLGSDFTILRFANDNDNFIGIPLLEMVEDEAMALNEVLTLMVQHYRKFPGQLIAEQGSLDTDTVQRLIDATQGAIQTVPDINKMKFIPPLSMGGDYFNIVNVLLSLIDRTLGIPDFKRTGMKSHVSATASGLVADESNIRKSYFLGRIKEFIIANGERITAIKQQFSNEIEYIQDTGDISAKPIKYTKEDIQGEYQLDFNIDSLGTINQAEATNFMNLLNIMAQNPALQPVLQKLDPQKLGKKAFKKIGNMNIEELQTEEPENFVHVPATRENELARGGDPMPQPKKGEDHNEHIKVHMTEIKNKGPNDQILQHVADTILLAQKNGKDVTKVLAEFGLQIGSSGGQQAPQAPQPGGMMQQQQPGEPMKEPARQASPQQLI